jgi:hypothetical protein
MPIFHGFGKAEQPVMDRLDVEFGSFQVVYARTQCRLDPLPRGRTRPAMCGLKKNPKCFELVSLDAVPLCKDRAGPLVTVILARSSPHVARLKKQCVLNLFQSPQPGNDGDAALIENIEFPTVALS